MYGCDYSVGCLSVSGWRIGGGISVKAERVDIPNNLKLEISANRIGEGLFVYAKRVDIPKDRILATALRVGSGLKIYASVVCSVNKDAYLRVSPDVVWLTPDMIGGEFDIYSNVVWRIDIEDVEPEEPVIVLYLNNETMIINDTLLKNEDMTMMSSLRNETLVQNMYYFINQQL